MWIGLRAKQWDGGGTVSSRGSVMSHRGIDKFAPSESDLRRRAALTPHTTPRPPSVRFATSGWVILARTLGALAFTISSGLAARVLSPDDFGRYSLIASITVGAGFLAAAGMNRSLLKSIAIQRTLGQPAALAARQRLASRVLRVSLPTVGLATGLATVAILGVGPPGPPGVILCLLIAVLVVLSGLQLIVADSLRAYQRRVAASFLEGRSGGAASFVALALILVPGLGHSLGLTTVVALNTAAFAVVLAGFWWTLRRDWRATGSVRESVGETDPAWRRPFLRMSAAFVGTQLFAFASSQGDLWVMAAIVSASQLSLFAAGFRLVTVIAMPLLALQLTLTPVVAELHATGRMDALEATSRRAATLGMLPALVSLTVLAIFPHQTLRLVFGASYTDATTAALLLAVGQVVNGVSGIGGQVLAMSGHQRDVLWVSAFALAVKLTLGIPAAETWGIVGYAAVSSAVTALTNVLYVAVARRQLGIWTHPELHMRQVIGDRPTAPQRGG